MALRLALILICECWSFPRVMRCGEGDADCVVEILYVYGREPLLGG